VSLSSAEAYPVGESQKALAVEVCQCPIGYAGSSCEVSLILLILILK